MMKFALAAFCAGCLATATPALAHDGATGVVKERMELMKIVGQSTKAAAPFATGAIQGSLAPVEASANAIAKAAKDSLSKYPEGSQDAVSEAKDTIWSDRAGFEKLMNTLSSSAEALAAAAKSGDRGKTQAAFGEMTQTCKMCHRQYREKK